MRLVRGLIWLTGASTGIGKSTAILLAKNRWKVAVSARNAASLKRLEESSNSIYAYPMDVSDPVMRKEVYNKIRRDHGPIDILINNAGYGMRGAVEEMELSELRDLFDVNVFAPLALSKLVLPEMRQRRAGRIIMISSVVGRVAFPLSGAYSASKFALEGFGDALRAELMPWNVKVILVEPGPIATQFGEVAKSASTSKFRDNDSPYARYYKRIMEKGYFKRSSYWGSKVVAESIQNACQNPNPRTRYPVHTSSVYLPWLSRLLPTKIFDRLMNRVPGLNQPAPMS
ncbi:MAG: SDR family oxidoreductase [Candidatus Electryonea clarkiae]|nr:SDR family oxidoreductase [Candidatus Electryonea clarkiae]MDP8287466.1 SDR family oxidoreductase [Candidatus Electryonea clarkiae]